MHGIVEGESEAVLRQLRAQEPPDPLSGDGEVTAGQVSGPEDPIEGVRSPGPGRRTGGISAPEGRDECGQAGSGSRPPLRFTGQ
ncbi:MAG: hypothetical protein ACRELA_12810 [Candidatus Rokuibacteriota bacterium]